MSGKIKKLFVGFDWVLHWYYHRVNSVYIGGKPTVILYTYTIAMQVLYTPIQSQKSTLSKT